MKVSCWYFFNTSDDYAANERNVDFLNEEIQEESFRSEFHAVFNDRQSCLGKIAQQTIAH